MKDITNNDAVIQQLQQAATHLQDLAKEVATGDYGPDGDLCYSTAVRHIYEHLNRSYHYADMEQSEIDTLSQEDFEALTDRLPVFLTPLKLGQ